MALSPVALAKPRKQSPLMAPLMRGRAFRKLAERPAARPPTTPIPGAVSARSRQAAATEAARQRAAATRYHRVVVQMDAVVREGRLLTSLIRKAETMGARNRPLVHYTGSWPCVDRWRPESAHWSKGLRFPGGVQAWSSSHPRLPSAFRGRPDQWMRTILQAIETQDNRLSNEINKLERLRRSSSNGLSDVVHTDSSPFLLLLLGVTAGYLVFNAVTT